MAEHDTATAKGDAKTAATTPEPEPAAPACPVTRLLALQRSAGNAAVAGVLARKDPPAASMPPPNSSQAADPEVLHFEGKQLRFDGEVLYRVLLKLQEEKGLMAPAEFTGRLRNANPLTLFKGTERPGLYHDVLKGLDDANARLDHERGEFNKQFEKTANQAAEELLAKSEEKLKAEKERLGITGEVERDPSAGGVPNFEISNKAAAGALRAAAKVLAAGRHSSPTPSGASRRRPRRSSARRRSRTRSGCRPSRCRGGDRATQTVAGGPGGVRKGAHGAGLRAPVAGHVRRRARGRREAAQAARAEDDKTWDWSGREIEQRIKNIKEVRRRSATRSRSGVSRTCDA